MSSQPKPKYLRPALVDLGPNLDAVGACSTGSVHNTGACPTFGYSGGDCHTGGMQGYWTCAFGDRPNYYCHVGTRTTSCTTGGRADTQTAATLGRP